MLYDVGLIARRVLLPSIIYSHAIGLCMAALQTALRAASGKSSAGREPSH